MITPTIVKTVLSTVISTVIGNTDPVIDPLMFYALDDVVGTFSADVITGTGSLTEARTSTIYLPDDSNPVVWKPYVSGVQGEYYAGGKWWLYGAPARTNNIRYSRDLTNIWYTTGESPVVTYDAVGLEGLANTATTLTDDSATTQEGLAVGRPISDDSNTNVLRVFIKKDTDETRFPNFNLYISSGTLAQEINVQVNTKTGAGVNWYSVGTVAYEVNQIGGWWEIILSVDNNSTGNTLATTDIKAAKSLTLGSTDNAAIGSIIIGNVELYLNTTIASVRGSSPIFTAGATVSINATDLSFDDANHDDTQGLYYCEFMPLWAVAEIPKTNYGVITTQNAVFGIMYTIDNARIRSYDGTNTAETTPVIDFVNGTTYQLAVGYAAASMYAQMDANRSVDAVYDGSYTQSLGNIAVLGGLKATTLIRNIRRYDLNLADGKTKADELIP